MNILNIEVSLFKGGIRNTVPAGTVNLFDFITKTTPERIASVQRVRECTDKKQQDELKTHVDYITASGIFSPTRKTENLIKHSGIICIDLDQQHNPGVDFAVVKKQVARLSWVAACTYSIRGQGLAMYVPIKYPERHKQHFARLEADFAAYGLSIDKACSDVTRARFDTFDPDPYINIAATVYEKLQEAPPARPTVQRRTSAGPVHDDVFRWACHQVEHPTSGREAFQFVQGQRHPYIFNLCCILNTYGVPRHEAEAWIDVNLMPLHEIKSNCISGPYSAYAADHGKQVFRPAGQVNQTARPDFSRMFTVLKRPRYEATATPAPTPEAPAPEAVTTTATPFEAVTATPAPEDSPFDGQAVHVTAVPVDAIPTTAIPVEAVSVSITPEAVAVVNKAAHTIEADQADFMKRVDDPDEPCFYQAHRVARSWLQAGRSYLQTELRAVITEAAGVSTYRAEKALKKLLQAGAVYRVRDTDFFKFNMNFKDC